MNACNLATGECHEHASGLPLPIAVAVDRKGGLFAAIFSLVPGQAQVVPLP